MIKTKIKNIKFYSVNLILTSLLFALTSQKEYGNNYEQKYIKWFLQFSEEFKRLMIPDGSFVVNLCWTYLSGYPTQDNYQ